MKMVSENYTAATQILNTSNILVNLKMMRRLMITNRKVTQSQVPYHPRPPSTLSNAEFRARWRHINLVYYTEVVIGGECGKYAGVEGAASASIEEI
jgi:hypothetical protein